MESVANFSLRFQNLRCQLTRDPTEDEAKETFLVALRRPLRTTLGLQNFTRQTVDTFIEKALQLELEDEENGLSMLHDEDTT